jgi:hypothetical protein
MSAMLPDYEKLGAFYLGRRKDDGSVLLYDSRDLVTHAVCVGMTGSGKTGLCIGLLEEAAIDGIPSLVIDPKGDLANLLLTFPDLAARDFEPWVNAAEAQTAGLSVSDFAAAEAAKWAKGLAKWNEDGERIRRLKDSAEFAVYTPGSDAGIPISILKSFAAPDAAILSDREALRDRIAGAATSLLALAGIEADPVQSREHILLSTILDTAWRARQDLDLPAVIAAVQKPAFSKVGVLDLDSFYPPKERFTLAMALNNVLASPGFEAWLTGEPLDIGSLLWTPQGKPRVSVISIAHLSDTERMFFVSLLLNQVLSWVRAQPGTQSLRAILYMDEIFGYFPPVANPPSKRPLLTILKQARAYGLGVVLATQNPVDLDYKGLANTGTWFIGRLQTERDKARVLEGLEGAAAASNARFDRAAMEQTLAGLGNRVFLLNNVHEDAPVLFETRWTLSYLRGPLARPEIRRLMSGRAAPAAPVAAPPAAAPAKAAAASAAPSTASTAAPVLPPEVPQFFIPLTGAVQQYDPGILGAAQVRFADPKLGVDTTSTLIYAAQIADAAVPVDWAKAEALEIALDALSKQPTEGATFSNLPSPAANAKNYTAWQKSFAAWIYQNQTLNLLKSASLGAVSNAGESERDFRIRLQHTAREQRDRKIEELRAEYASKIRALTDRIQRAQMKLEQEKQQATAQTVQTALSVGTSLLGAFMGRKTISATNINRIGTAARSAARTGKERGDVTLAESSVESLQQQLQEMESQLQNEIDSLTAASDPATEQFEALAVRPKKTAISIQLVALVWR